MDPFSSDSTLFNGRLARAALPPQQGDDIKTYSWVELDEMKSNTKIMSCGPCELVNPASVRARKSARRLHGPKLFSQAHSHGHQLAMANVLYKWEPKSKYRVVVSYIGKTSVLARLNTRTDSGGDLSATNHGNPVTTAVPLPMSALLLSDANKVDMATLCIEGVAPSLTRAGLMDVFASASTEGNNDNGAEMFIGEPIDISGDTVVCSASLDEWTMEGDVVTHSSSDRTAQTA
jgi:hypothetical protein